MIANDAQEGRALAAHAAGLAAGGIALVTEDSDSGRSFASGAKQSLEELGRGPARTEIVQPGSGLDALGTALNESGAEVVLYGGEGQTGVNLVQALRSKGFTGPVVTSHQVRMTSPDGLGDQVTGSSLGAPPDAREAEAFDRMFRREVGSAPPIYALEAYEGALMLLESIEEVEANAGAVTRFLSSNRTFRGDSKPYVFDETGELPGAPVWIFASSPDGWAVTGRSDRVSAALEG